MAACSRCGTTDNRHSMKCLKAMAFGLAMGVEERPTLVAAPVRLEDELERERVGASQLEEELSRLHAEMDLLGEKLIAAQTEAAKEHAVALRWQQRYDQLAAQWDSGMVTTPVTQLPPGYYDAKVSPERLAEIEREVAALNESPHLEVEVHDELNATVRPRRDDDYTEAGVAAAEQLDTDESYPDHGPEDDAAAALGLPSKTAGTDEPAEGWPAFIRALRLAKRWSYPQLAEALGCSRSHAQNFEYGKRTVSPEWAEKLRALAVGVVPHIEPPAPEVKPKRGPRKPGGMADPDYMHPDVPAFLADNIEASDNPADYVTTARISSVLAAWNTKNGKKLGAQPVFRAIAKQYMRGKPIHQGKQVDGYYGIKVGGKSDGTAPFVPDRKFDAAARVNDERIGVAGAWKSPESQYIDACVTEFLDANLIVTQDRNDWLAGPDLRAAYDQWAHEQGKPDSDAYPSVERAMGALVAQRALGKQQRTYEGKLTGVGAKPLHFRGVRLGKVPVEADAQPILPAAPEKAKPKITPADLDPREKNKRDVEELRSLMKASTSRVEEVPAASVTPTPGPDEMAMKLAQLKHFGIGGVEGVSRDAARTAVADLHPTGNTVWTSVPGETWSDSDLEATAYQLLVKCMDGLPEEIGFDYKEDVLATAGFREEDVVSAVRHPQRVEIRPESWDKEKRYPILGFTKGDVQVIMGMRQPTKPRVIAAYWTSLLAADAYRVARHGGGGSKKSTGLPTSPAAAMSRLRAAGCELDGDPMTAKALKVTYKGQDLGKITCGNAVPKLTVQSDYQRTVRKMQAIDRRAEAKAG
jgi:hypothetical protein